MMTVKEARIHIQLLRLKGQILEMRCGLCEIETRINNNHDPKTGRFTSGKGVDIGAESGIIKEIKACGLIGEVNLPPKKIDINSLSYDSKHFLEKKRDISFEDAKSYIKNARFSISRWKGQYENYFSDDGASYVNLESKEIKTSFRRKDFTESIIRALEVLDKHDKQQE